MDRRRQETLWDVLMANLIPSVMDGLSSAPVGVLVGMATSGTHDHHVIPKYVCGHPQQQLSTIPRGIHNEIHQQLYGFQAAVEIAGKTIQVLFRKKKPFKESLIKKIGQTPSGRYAIAAGLELFYTSRNYSSIGKPIIGASLAYETPRFVRYHHSCK